MVKKALSRGFHVKRTTLPEVLPWAAIVAEARRIHRNGLKRDKYRENKEKQESKDSIRG